MVAEIAFGQARSGTAESNPIPSPSPLVASAVALCWFHLCSRVLSSRLFQSTSRSLFHTICSVHNRVCSRSHTITEMRFLQPLATPAVLSLLSSVAGTYGFVATRRATVCNGHAEVRRVYVRIQRASSNVRRLQLCDRSFGNVTFVGAHDSYAVGTNSGQSRGAHFSLSLYPRPLNLAVRSLCQPGLQ